MQLTRSLVKNIFQSIATDHGRKLVVDVDRDDVVECHLAADNGLQFKLYFQWLGDQFGLFTDFCYMEFFIDRKGDAAVDFVDVANEILSNKVRLLCFSRKGTTVPYKVRFQHKENGKWVTFYTSAQFWPWSLFPKQELKYFFAKNHATSSP